MQSLNAAQQAAVDFDGASLLIVAGAGTGKTATLAARVGALIEGGTPPERIMLLTFTRRAAAELLARAGQYTDAAATHRVWGGTFHSVALRVLRSHGATVGLDPQFTVIDQGDAVDCFGLVRAERADVTASRFPKKETIAAIYDRVVGTQRKLSEVVPAEYPWVVPHIEALPPIFDGYVQRKRTLRVVDFTDLLLLWRALMSHPEVRGQLAQRFDHIIVDEFQDTDPIQADIVHAYGDAGCAVTAVGDDAQSIYGFRSATVANMWTFTERRPGANVVTLEDNYRSTQPILDVANAVLAQSDQHFKKVLRATRPGGEMPHLITHHDELSQAVAVCEAVLELRELGLELADQAVLFRSSHHSDVLELELAKRNIPFKKWGGLKFLEAAHVKDVIAAMRVIENPFDELAWNRVIRLFPGVGPATARRVLAHLGFGSADPAAGDDALDPLGRFMGGESPVPAVAREEYAALVNAFRLCVERGDDEVGAQLDVLLDWYRPVLERRYDRHPARLSDLQQIRVSAEGYRSRQRFLAELMLEPPASSSDLADEPHLDEEVLTLSTVHSAKGAEWAAVHLLHATDGNFPSDMALHSIDGLEEERRLMYVALTRARDTLRVSVPLRYHIHRSSDAHTYAPVSRFLSPCRDRFVLSTDERDQGDEPGALSISLTDEIDVSNVALWQL